MSAVPTKSCRRLQQSRGSIGATGLSEDQVVDSLAAMRMARTVSLDKLAKVGHSDPVAAVEQPGHQMEQAELRQLLAQEIAALPERKRLAVTLYYLEDLRLKEIGDLLGLSESRVCACWMPLCLNWEST